MRRLFGILLSVLKSKLFRYAVLAVFLGCLVGGGIAFIKLYMIAQTLPPVEEITRYRMNQPSMVYDAEGSIIAELGNERRYPIHIEEMPLYIQQAVVATEDARFYEHTGIDLKGIMRAMWSNIKSRRIAEGGSTLTQQLVKNIYLSPEKKFIRKYKEAVLAYRLERFLTKDEILEYYLNQVNFGRGAYGVQAAAVSYFGKNAVDMTLAECALLAAIPKAPGLYAPHTNPARALERRNSVLSRMAENGYITEELYWQTIEEPIVITESAPLKRRYAGYFLDHVLRYLSDELGVTEPQNLGLQIYTTLDARFQLKAEEVVRNNIIFIARRIGYFGPTGHVKEAIATEIAPISTDEEIEAAAQSRTIEKLLEVPGYLANLGYKKAVVTEVADTEIKLDLKGLEGNIKIADTRWAKPHDSTIAQLNSFKTILKAGDIIYVSKKPGTAAEAIDYLLEQDPPLESSLLAIDPESGSILAMVGGFAFEKSMFNRATQAKRQTGSVIKPMVYAAALENGRQPMTKVLDAPIITAPDESGMVWRPRNNEDRYYGETTLKEGLTRSRNIVTIRTSEMVGLRRIVNYMRRFGITSDMPMDMSITIGSGSVSLLEMVYAYSVFPNMGTRVDKPYFVTRVEDSDGNILYDLPQPEHVEVIKPATAQVMTDILVNVVEKGTAFRAKAITRPVGAKTGTSNEGRDAWFMGFMPNLAVGVWAGFDNFSSAASVGYGSQSSGPTWVDFVSAVLPYVEPAVFPVAENVEYKKVNIETWEPTDELDANLISFEPYLLEDSDTDNQSAGL